MRNEKLSILLADDDRDDCIFFKEALEELPVNAALTTVNDGVQLIQHLTKHPDPLPNVLFLDLNMPRKNGFECLNEIKSNDQLKQLPVIVFSTSFDKGIADRLYEKGAHFYIRKPAEFPNLKKVILKSITLIAANKNAQPSKEEFVITS